MTIRFLPRCGGRWVLALLAASAPAIAAAAPSTTSPNAAASDAAAPDRDDTDAAERARLEEELAAQLGADDPAPDRPPSAPLPTSPLELGAVGTFVASWFSDEPTTRLPAHEPSHRGFQLQEFEIAIRSNVDPFFAADVFLAFSLGGVEVEEAYVTTRALPWNLQLRGGSFHAPFGRFNQRHFLEQTPFADLPLPNRRFFGGEMLRGLGAEASLLLPLPFFLELRAAAMTAGNELSFGVPGAEVEALRDLLGVARLLASFDPAEQLTFNLGVSAANGPNASGGAAVTDENRTDVFGADLYVHLRDPASIAYVALQAEWMLRRAAVPGGRLDQGGFYVWLVRRFDRRWEAAIRWDQLGLPGGSATGAPAVEDPTLATFLAPARQRRLGASISRYFSEFSRLRLQANHDFGLDVDGAGGAAVTELFLQFQFAIGAHGAHRF